MKLNLSSKRTRQNKRYNYTPRYYKGKEEGNLYDFGTKIEKSMDTYNTVDFGNHWRDARNSSRTRANRGLNRTIIYVIAILVFLFLWLIDFDLSIFSKPS